MTEPNKNIYSGNLCIKTVVLPYVEEMSDLLSIAFGPMGDAVMVHQKSPNEIKVTKVNRAK